MSDFDFDELDKAVSGAANTTPSPAATRSEALVTSEAPEAPSTPVSSTTPEASVTPPADQAAPAARRSNGRFMDMVRTPSYAARPRPEDAGADRTSTTPTRPTPSPEELQAKIQSITSTAPTDALNYESSQLDTQDDTQKPLDSPFLPDAKVEKRPLGGAAPTGFSALDLLEEPDDPRLEANIETAPEVEAPTEQPLPDPIDFVEQNQTPEAEAEDAMITQPATEPVAPEPTTPTEQPEPAGPTSITQQYEAHPSTATESGSIYDTEAYHQPLAPAPKKKSGAWAILWIVLLLLVGGAVGAAIYFYVLPLL